eukprot:scaffold173826_cov62-Attheya_sp.AAC.7
MRHGCDDEIPRKDGRKWHPRTMFPPPHPARWTKNVPHVSPFHTHYYLLLVVERVPLTSVPSEKTIGPLWTPEVPDAGIRVPRVLDPVLDPVAMVWWIMMMMRDPLLGPKCVSKRRPRY